jgi:neutral amino acid transport system permease protein
VNGRVAVLALALGVLLAPAGAYAQGQSVHGTLRAPDGTAVAGVTVTATRNGAEIGKATTPSDGKWEIPLPGAGRYTITLDVATLPAGLSPAREDGQTLKDVAVPDGESRAVIFQLTAGTPAPGTGPGQAGGGGGGPPPNAVVRWLDEFPQLLVEGIKFGSIIAITAVGLSLIFGLTGLINFAHGELVTLGATVAFMLNASVLGPQLQLIPAVLVTVAFGAAPGTFAINEGNVKESGSEPGNCPRGGHGLCPLVAIRSAR